MVKKILCQNYVVMEGVPATVGMHWAKELLDKLILYGYTMNVARSLTKNVYLLSSHNI